MKGAKRLIKFGSIAVVLSIIVFDASLVATSKPVLYIMNVATLGYAALLIYEVVRVCKNWDNDV
jgi:hypothetical protein